MTNRCPYLSEADGTFRANHDFMASGPEVDSLEKELPGFSQLMFRWVSSGYWRAGVHDYPGYSGCR